MPRRYSKAGLLSYFTGLKACIWISSIENVEICFHKTSNDLNVFNIFSITMEGERNINQVLFENTDQ
jgi:hypothetical protein